MTELMSEIASASNEQSRGIEQVATAVSQMDLVTQQNAALVEQSTGATAALEDQANNPVDTVALSCRITGHSVRLCRLTVLITA